MSDLSENSLKGTILVHFMAVGRSENPGSKYEQYGGDYPPPPPDWTRVKINSCQNLGGGTDPPCPTPLTLPTPLFFYCKLEEVS